MKDFVYIKGRSGDTFKSVYRVNTGNLAYAKSNYNGSIREQFAIRFNLSFIFKLLALFSIINMFIVIAVNESRYSGNINFYNSFSILSRLKPMFNVSSLKLINIPNFAFDELSRNSMTNPFGVSLFGTVSQPLVYLFNVFYGSINFVFTLVVNFITNLYYIFQFFISIIAQI